MNVVISYTNGWTKRNPYDPLLLPSSPPPPFYISIGGVSSITTTGGIRYRERERESKYLFRTQYVCCTVRTNHFFKKIMYSPPTHTHTLTNPLWNCRNITSVCWYVFLILHALCRVTQRFLFVFRRFTCVKQTSFSTKMHSAIHP